MQAAQAVGEAEVEQGLKPGALFGGAEDFALPFFGVVHIQIGGGDVEITEQHQFRVLRQFAADKFGQRGKPLLLVGKLLAAHGFAVHAIYVHHAHAADGGGNHAPLRVVWQGGQAGMHVLRFFFAEDGHAVVGFLPAPHGAVAKHFEGGKRELVLIQFELLQAEHVGLMLNQPVAHVRQANFEGVYVPSGDFHGVCFRNEFFR